MWLEGAGLARSDSQSQESQLCSDLPVPCGKAVGGKHHRQTLNAQVFIAALLVTAQIANSLKSIFSKLVKYVM